jgi:cytochrome c peroxidase
MYQKFGVMGDYFTDRGHIIDQDYGRFSVTRNEEDRFVFKVPSLRNVELTAPYFHDGSAATLDHAVDVMAKYQLGRALSSDERKKLVAYLKSLTGTLPAGDTDQENKGNMP